MELITRDPHPGSRHSTYASAHCKLSTILQESGVHGGSSAIKNLANITGLGRGEPGLGTGVHFIPLPGTSYKR